MRGQANSKPPCHAQPPRLYFVHQKCAVLNTAAPDRMRRVIRFRSARLKYLISRTPSSAPYFCLRETCVPSSRRNLVSNAFTFGSIPRAECLGFSSPSSPAFLISRSVSRTDNPFFTIAAANSRCLRGSASPRRARACPVDRVPS